MGEASLALALGRLEPPVALLVNSLRLCRVTKPNTYGGRSSVLDLEPLRVGLIGAGGIAQTHYKGYVAAGARIMGFAEPVEATRTRRAAEWGVPGYASVEELLERADIEAVSVCTPNSSHAPATIAAAESGKHVLCEKPLSLNLEECSSMIQAAKNAGVVLQTGHHLRANWYVRKAKELIESGAIGRVCFVRLRQAHDWGGNKTVSPNFATYERAGGGTLLDNGCHMMDLARNLAGNVKSLFARTATLGFDIEVEDVGVVNLEFESGAIGSVEAAWTATGWEEGFWVYGTDGALECTNRLGKRRLRFANRLSTGTDWTKLDETIFDVQDEGGHGEEINSFIRSIRLGEPVICTGEDGLESVRLVLSSYESARSNQPVTF
jgi:predicted dehydrogenase